MADAPISVTRRYRDLDPRAWQLALVRTVNTGGLSLVMVFMGIYMVSARGLALAEYGIIVLVSGVIQSWAQGFAGLISDRHGRRRVMASALSLRSGVIGLLGGLVLADSPVLLIAVLLIVSSVLRGAFEPVAHAFVADIVTPEERVAAFGLQRMGTNLGWAIGPATGGALLQVVDYGVVFFCAAPALLACALLVLRLEEPDRGAPAHAGRPYAPMDVVRALIVAGRNPTAAIFLGGVFLMSVSHLQLFTTLSVYAKQTLGLSEALIGRAYAINAGVVLLLQVPAVALIGRTGSRTALCLGAGLFAASFFLVGWAQSFLGIGVAVAVLTVGEVLLAPAQQAIVAELGDPTQYGRAFGVMGTVTMLGVAIAPLVGGLAFDHLGRDGTLMWSVLAAFPLIMFGAFVWFSVRSRAERRPGGAAIGTTEGGGDGPAARG